MTAFLFKEIIEEKRLNRWDNIVSSCSPLDQTGNKHLYGMLWRKAALSSENNSQIIISMILDTRKTYSNLK